MYPIKVIVIGLLILIALTLNIIAVFAMTWIYRVGAKADTPSVSVSGLASAGVASITTNSTIGPNLIIRNVDLALGSIGIVPYQSKEGTTFKVGSFLMYGSVAAFVPLLILYLVVTFKTNEDGVLQPSNRIYFIGIALMAAVTTFTQVIAFFTFLVASFSNWSISFSSPTKESYIETISFGEFLSAGSAALTFLVMVFSCCIKAPPDEHDGNSSKKPRKGRGRRGSP